MLQSNRQMHSRQLGSSRPQRPTVRSAVAVSAGSQAPLLLRVARGEDAERTPVWLMRQAGRYMAAFREFSDKYAFRKRSETPEIAIELSLQPWRSFHTDGVIFFSDILTPLPAMGIEFDVIKGKGPLIADPVRSLERVRRLKTIDDPQRSLPFINTILSTLRAEVDSGAQGAGEAATLLGFIGTPWTLAAYAMEGKADKECRETKKIMFSHPEILHALLDHLTESLITYASYQIESGAQIIQLFDSWAHHLTPDQFAIFSMPYAERVIRALKAKYPHVPVIFHGNGGTGKLEAMHGSAADVIGLDWAVDMAVARDTLGRNVRVQGHVDPMVLFGPEAVIRAAVTDCLHKAGPSGHILNVGHGVAQGTPEENVKFFCQLARESASIHRAAAGSQHRSQRDLQAVRA